MQLGAISSLLSTLPEMWQWTTAGLQYQAAGGGDAPSEWLKARASTRASMDRIGAVAASEKPRSRLAKGREEQARFDGRGESSVDHRLGSLPFKLFILLASQIENFGLTESRAKVLVSGQQGQWSTKKCRGT